MTSPRAPSEFLLHLSDRLRSLSDPVEVVLSAARVLGEHLGVPRVGYGEIDEDAGLVRVRADWTDGTLPSLAGEARLLEAFGPDLIADLRGGNTIAVVDCLVDPRAGDSYAESWASIGTRSLIVAPLLRSGGLQGILYVHHPSPRQWTPVEAGLASEVAERTWEAVQRARAEAALRESEARFRLFSQESREGIVVHDGTTILDCNAAYASTFGYGSVDELIGRSITDTIAPESIPLARSKIEARDEEPFEVVARCKDGSTLPAEIVAREATWQSRRVRVVLARDLTETRRRQAELREREAHLSAMFEQAAAGIAEVDLSGRFLRVNDRFCQIVGRTRDELQSNLRMQDITHADDLPQNLRLFRRTLETGEPFEIEKRYIRPNGELTWVSNTVTLVRTDETRPATIVAVTIDITARRAAEEALRASAEHLRLLMNELNHRVKNTLATVQSIASQTLRSAASPAEARHGIERRLIALSRAHDVLTREQWEGAYLEQIVQQALEPFRVQGHERIYVGGPQVRLSPRVALAIAMALQELATNATKYGALSNATGEIRLSWSIAEDDNAQRLHLSWHEAGGPPVNRPDRKGFGSRLIERSVAQELNGRVSLEFAPTGLVCTIDADLQS